MLAVRDSNRFGLEPFSARSNVAENRLAAAARAARDHADHAPLGVERGPAGIAVARPARADPLVVADTRHRTVRAAALDRLIIDALAHARRVPCHVLVDAEAHGRVALADFDRCVHARLERRDLAERLFQHQQHLVGAAQIRVDTFRQQDGRKRHVVLLQLGDLRARHDEDRARAIWRLERRLPAHHSQVFAGRRRHAVTRREHQAWSNQRARALAAGEVHDRHHRHVVWCQAAAANAERRLFDRLAAAAEHRQRCERCRPTTHGSGATRSL